MSLSASMWTAVTGLLVHGEKMNVVGNNIANVNTVGFKGSRMDFEDFVNQNVFAASGPSQVGRGVSIGAIYGNFTQGSFEQSTDPTDLAISGEGFFKVKPINTDTEYYTRAGNFRFNADGYLVDPHGYALQGWRIQQPTPSLGSSSGTAAGSSSASSLKGTGTPTNIKLESFTCDPKHTNTMQAELNLSSLATGQTSSAPTNPLFDPTQPIGPANDPENNPFFALMETWDAQQDPALGENAYVHPYTTTIYDEGGTKHTVTIYFDKVESSELDPTTTEGGKQFWEYIVTMSPAEDHRIMANGQPMSDKSKGLLMAGTLEFNSAGEFMNMSAYVPVNGGAASATATNWVSAPVSSNGYPMFCPNFSGRPDASVAWDTAVWPPTEINKEAQNYLVELNLGLRNKTNAWSGGFMDASTIKNNPNNINGIAPADLERQPKRTKSYAEANATVNQSQDGYSFGYLSTVYVDRDGVLYGKYSNGQTLSLFQVALYDFVSPHNLRREGGNLFSETKESGDATSGPANSVGLGSVYGNSLEQSNVDLATEFVQMITTQRGFQANSKAITTVDTMLETVIGMKR